MTVREFNPSRLIVARKRRLLKKKELATKLHVELRTIVRWELAQSEPSSDNISALSEVLGFPAAFFFAGDIDEPLDRHTSFRSQTAMTAVERDAALAAGQIGFLVSDWVTERFELPMAGLPDLHLYEPEDAARMLRHEWALGEKPVSNMLHMLESKGVRVFSLAENTAHVNAFSLWRKNTPYVFLNTYKSAESSRFDSAHELAHLVLHQDGGVTGREAEEQANRFASAFLMPAADIRAALPQSHSLDKMIGAKRRWGVSLAALNYRLHKLQITTDWKYRDFCIAIVKRGFGKIEPNPIAREQSIVWEKVLKSLWCEGITPRDIAEQLFLPEGELSGLLGILNVESTPLVADGTTLQVFQATT